MNLKHPFVAILAILCLWGVSSQIFGIQSPKHLVAWHIPEQDKRDDAGILSSTNEENSKIPTDYQEGGMSPTICVDADAGGFNNGSCWDDAFTDLQDALAIASPGDEIWVADGVYQPGVMLTSTFSLKDDISIYGGFIGTEINREQRDWVNNVTVLSGDILDNDTNNDPINPNRSDNIYYVVISNGNNANTIIDGLTISGGNAIDNGGGMNNFNDSRVTINNINFINNSAIFDGGGMANYDSNPTVNNTTFNTNRANGVGGGIYNDNSNPQLNNVDFIGNVANVDGGGLGNFKDSNAILNDVTFTLNTANGAGGGISNNNSIPIIKNTSFTNNSALAGGGAYNFKSNPIFSNVTFLGNIATNDGGGMHSFESSPVISNAYFRGNSANDAGGAISNINSTIIINHTILSGNWAGITGGGIFNYSDNIPTTPQISNVTLTGNRSDDVGGGIVNDNSNPIINNSIIWNNDGTNGLAGTDQVYNLNSGSSDVSYSIVEGGWAGTGNKNENPQFTDPIEPNEAPTQTGDFHLITLSPAIDAGNNNAVSDDIADLDGDLIINEPLPLDIEGQPRFRDNSTPDTGNGTPPIVDIGAYEAEDSIGTINIIYVDINADGSNNGISWENAFVNLQDALSSATENHEIWVTSGIYKPTLVSNRDATFQLINNVAIYGGFTGTETTRDQRNWQENVTTLSGDLLNNDNSNIQPNEPTRIDNSYHVVSGNNTDSTAILDGFTIAGGNADNNGGGVFINTSNSNPSFNNVVIANNTAATNGAGMYNKGSHPTLTNVFFSNNWAGDDGGGMHNFNGSNPTLNTVTFDNNSANSNGGGLYNNNSSPTLQNVSLNNNWAGDDGGGLHNFNGSSPALNNVVFNNNSTNDNGGGMYNNNGDPHLKWVTFINNSASGDGGGMHNFNGSQPIMSNVIIQGNSASGDGGGISNHNFHVNTDSAIMSNVLIVGNFAGRDGGGMFSNNSSPMLGTVTISGNRANDDGGGIHNFNDSNPEISNSILWNNKDSSGFGALSQIHNTSGSTPVVTNSIVQGSWAGSGNLDENPQFVQSINPDHAPINTGDFHLQPTSPAIDAGANGLLFDDTNDLDDDSNIIEPLPYDLDGLVRLTGVGGNPPVDLGAYEVAEPPGLVVINEIAWAGTDFSDNDEWIELFNASDAPVNLTNWTITVDETTIIPLTGTINANSYYLLERSSDNTVSDLQANLVYTTTLGLANSGGSLELRDGSDDIIDLINFDLGEWPAGNDEDSRFNTEISFATMERIDPLLPGLDHNWATNDTIQRNGLDANGQPLNGTPLQPNSINFTEIDDSCPNSTDIPIGQGNVSGDHFSLLRSNNDEDYFTFEVPDPYTTIIATLAEPKDLDFRLYSKCDGVVGDIYHIGQVKQLGENTIQFNVGRQTGSFFLRIRPIPNSYSGKPYKLDIELQTTNVSSVKTLIFYNHMRFGDRYGASAASQVMENLTQLASDPNVQGTIVQLDQYPNVQAAYDAWDAIPITSPKANVQAANDVTDVIRDVMIASLDINNFPLTEYVVLVGDDHQIPFRRMNIKPTESDPAWVNESAYLLNSGNTPIGIALLEDQTLTDDIYGDFVIRPWQTDHDLYLPELAVGRLLETPGQIQTVIEAFLNNNGKIVIESGAVAGQGFLADSALAQCELLQSVNTNVDCQSLITNSYNGNHLFQSFIEATPNVVSNNWHTNHTEFLAPIEDEGSLDANTILTATADLTEQLWWSVGCQTTLVIPNDSNPEYQLSLAQALSEQGVTYVGNTGWSWGSADAIVLSERLYELFTENLTSDGFVTVGNALQQAKRQYYIESAVDFSYYEEKVMTEATLFGLPMLQIEKPTLPKATMFNTFEILTTAYSNVEQSFYKNIDSSLETVEKEFITGTEFTSIEVKVDDLSTTQVQTDNGTFFKGSTIDANANQPIVPQSEHLGLDPSQPGVARGVIWLGGQYTQQTNNPVIGSVFPLNTTTVPDEVNFGGVYPRIPTVFTTIINRDGTSLDRVVYDTGQYIGNEDTGIIRLFNDISFMVGYSTSNDDVPPTVGNILSEVSNGQLNLSLPVTDDSGIYKVYVTFTEQNNLSGTGQWESVEMQNGGGSIYEASLNLTKPTTYFVQMMDNAGNVATLLPETGYFSAGANEHIYLPMIVR